MDPRLKIILYGNPEEELSLLMRLENPKFAPQDCKIISQFGDIVSCRITRKNLDKVYNSKEVKSLKAPNVVPADDYLNENEITYNYNHFVSTNQKSNVVFGLIDFGFDFTHEDFIDNGKTRIEKIWVQSAKYATPNKYGYGKYIEQNQLNDALKEEFPFKKIGYHPGSSDLFGTGTHGTHVMGIACSNGKIAKKGFASNSPIIAVDMGTNYVNGSNLSLGDSVNLVEGLDFILREAGNRPVVINMSLGGHGDAHTGKTLVEQAIDNILTSRKGTAIVQSTGNYHQARAHTYGNIKQNEKVLIPWLFKKRDQTANEMEIWYEGEDVMAVNIIDDNGTILLQSTPFEDEIISNDNDEIGICLHRKNEPNTGKNQIDILINGRQKSKFWTVELIGKKISSGSYHCYIERDDKGQSIFLPKIVQKTHTTNSICNSKYSIVVGAYNQLETERPILPFSSSGPTIDGRMKPEVLAPGYKIKSSCSSSSREFKAKNKVCSKSGSSMAAPYVASLVVKILEKEPNLNIYEIRKKLFHCCEPFQIKDNLLEAYRAGNGYIIPKKIIN
jgi:subtilisin family serine protease